MLIGMTAARSKQLLVTKEKWDDFCLVASDSKTVPSVNSTLWWTNIAMENGHLKWIFPSKMVIFHSYVSLPEGIFHPLLHIFLTTSKAPNQVRSVQLLRTLSHGGLLMRSAMICPLEGEESAQDHHKNRGVGGWHLWSLNWRKAETIGGI